MSDAAEGEKRELSVKNVFGFAVVVGTKLPQSDALQSRSIKITSMEGKPRVSMSARNEKESDVKAAVLRGRLLNFRLQIMRNPPEREFPDLDNVRGRTKDKAFPILYSIPPSYDNSRIINEFMAMDEEEGEEYLLTENAEVVDCYCRCLEHLLESGSETLSVNVSDVHDKINLSRDEKEKIPSQKLGLMLKSIGFQRRKIRGNMRIPFSLLMARAQILTYNINLKEYEHLANYLSKRLNATLEAPSQVSPVSPVSPLSVKDRLMVAAYELEDGSDAESVVYILWQKAELLSKTEAEEGVAYLLRSGLIEKDENGNIKRTDLLKGGRR
jgi:hypothetical protein